MLAKRRLIVPDISGEGGEKGAGLQTYISLTQHNQSPPPFFFFLNNFEYISRSEVIETPK